MSLAPSTTRALLAVVLLPTLMAGKCEEPLVMDSGFDIWCGDSLCQWQLEAGVIRPAPTWHVRDLGVELVGEDVRLSQTVSASSRDVDCLRFNLLADIEEPASVSLDVTFDDAPTPDQQETLPNGAWTPLKYRIPAPTYFHSLRLTIHKSGAGRAVLAQIQALSSSDCGGVPPRGPVNRPAGATCEDSTQCASGSTCRLRGLPEQAVPDPSAPARSVCEACTSDVGCGAPNVCGLAYAADFADPFAACVAAGSAALGRRCRGDAECASGHCGGAGTPAVCVTDGQP